MAGRSDEHRHELPETRSLAEGTARGVSLEALVALTLVLLYYVVLLEPPTTSATPFLERQSRLACSIEIGVLAFAMVFGWSAWRRVDRHGRLIGAVVCLVAAWQLFDWLHLLWNCRTRIWR